MIRMGQARLLFLLIAQLGLSGLVVANPKSQDDVWTRIEKVQLRQAVFEDNVLPAAYEEFRLNRIALQSILNRARREFTNEPDVVLSLPMPDGTFQRFRIEHSLVVEPGLLVKYPELGATYRGYGIDDPTATARFDFLSGSFHSMILSRNGTVIVNPRSNADPNSYISFSKRNATKTRDFFCEVGGKSFDSILEPKDPAGLDFLSGVAAPEVTSGSQLRTYRLALAATHEYGAAVGTNTIAGALAAQVLIINRVNSVYERDAAIHVNLVANNDLIVFAGDSMACGGPCTAANDGYTNNDGQAMLGENQTKLDATIGTANYDIGHVFSTGGGGIAVINSPCNPGSKARGVTGLPNPTGDPFAIDFVAHELGHQWGASHTFNTTAGGCSGNRSGSAAYEPGSGVTVMAYAGLCGSQNLANASIDTFHVKSLEQIIAYSQTGNGNSCAVTTASGNTPPSVTGPGNFNIPKQTPFALTATASDVNNDTITYDWQEYDLGGSTSLVPNSDADGARPIFRPFSPTASGTRTFPRLTHILNNANVPPATTGNFLTGEILPSITRTMTFQVIARDNRANAGGVSTATSIVTVDGNSGPFLITAPNTGLTYAGNSTQNVTWNVANTVNAPVSLANVRILMSADGGNTFPTVLAANTPNDGSQLITIPPGNTSTGRIKVEALGNIFFDISDANFSVSGIAAPPRSRADFDGDGKTDLSVFRPSEGNWYLNRSTTGLLTQKWGLNGDIPVPADFDNDGKADLAIFRGSADSANPDFYVLNSATNTFAYTSWGLEGDIPVVGDYDGDGKADYGLWRPSGGTWYVLRSGGGFIATSFGASTDIPLAADFDGDMRTDLSVFRPGTGTWIVNPSTSGDVFTVPFGISGDMPVPADYNGDNKDDYALFRPSSGTWHIIDPVLGQVVTTAFGLTGDIPVPGDYDGDGRDDIAVYRNGTWYLNRSTSGLVQFNFGLTSDTPIPKKYIP